MAAELFGVALEMRILAAENDMAGDEEVNLGKGRERRWWWWKGITCLHYGIGRLKYSGF